MRTKWVKAVTQHLVTLSHCCGRQEEIDVRVCVFFQCVLVGNHLWTWLQHHPESKCRCVCSCCRTIMRRRKEERGDLFLVLLPGADAAVYKCTCVVTHKVDQVSHFMGDCTVLIPHLSSHILRQQCAFWLALVSKNQDCDTGTLLMSGFYPLKKA